MMNKTMMSRRFKSVKGFTLLEVAMAVIIGGMLLGLFGEQLTHTLHESKVKTTQYRLEETYKAINRFMILNNHFPCPANREMEMENDLYGFSVGTNRDAANRHGGGDCRSGDAAAGTVSNTGVRTGMIPTRTLNLPDEFGYDGWGSRIIYAVTENMTNGTTFGAVDGACQTGTALGGPCVVVGSNPQRAAFAVVSVGPDRIGGFNIYGNRLDCTVTPGRADSENCDDDNTFTDAAHSSTAHSGSSNYNDDMILYSSGSLPYSGVPSGAILPFRLDNCPKGWDKVKELEGAILVGSGTYGGSTTPIAGASPNVARGIAEGTPARYGTPLASGATVQEYDNYPPAIAYTYCVKS